MSVLMKDGGIDTTSKKVKRLRRGPMPLKEGRKFKEQGHIHGKMGTLPLLLKENIQKTVWMTQVPLKQKSSSSTICRENLEKALKSLQCHLQVSPHLKTWSKNETCTHETAVQRTREHPLGESLKSIGPSLMPVTRPQTDTVFPESSKTMKSDSPKIQSSLSQPQQSIPDDLFKGLSIHSKDDDKNDSESYAATGPSGAELPHISTQKIERGRLGGQPSDNKGKVEDVCNAEDRECNEDVEGFTVGSPSGPILQTKKNRLRLQTDAILPEPSHAMNRDFPKIQPQSSLSQPQQSTSDHISEESGRFTDEPLKIKNFECDEDKSRITKEYFGCASAVNEIESISERSVVPEVFTPESNPYNDRKSYRFPCSSEGLFQCRYTGLVFKMDTGGEVQYRTEPWNYTQLAKRNYVPAGPLFDIKCPQGTLSQIHFPHCEVFSGKGRKHLSVIHISDSDEYEMLDPHETTDSYVVLNISGCSEYGLTKRQPKKKCSPINGLVLLFLQESTLNVLLLPKNVDISEVYEKRKKMKEPTEEIYIETTSNCKLVPEKAYCLSSAPEEHEVTPLSATFLDYENYENYFPTFQVFLTKLERIKLNLKGEGSDECVWYSNLKFPASLIGGRPSVSSPSSPYTPLGQDFFHKHKAALEARLGSKITILSELERLGVLNTEEREEVKSNESRIKQNRTLLLMLENKGGTAQEKFYRVLKKCDGCLVEDLEGPYDYGT